MGVHFTVFSTFQTQLGYSPERRKVIRVNTLLNSNTTWIILKICLTWGKKWSKMKTFTHSFIQSSICWDNAYRTPALYPILDLGNVKVGRSLVILKSKKTKKKACTEDTKKMILGPPIQGLLKQTSGMKSKFSILSKHYRWFLST